MLPLKNQVFGQLPLADTKDLRQNGNSFCKKMSPKTVGVVGCTGAVGQEMIKVLADREFPINGKPRIFASSRSAGKVMPSAFGDLTVEEFAPEKMDGIDIVLMAVSGSFAKQYAQSIVDQGAVVIDNSSAFRMDDGVPLVCPEVNPEAIKDKNLISNPNCTTLILAVALWPIHKQYTCKKVITSTYQATSGAGQPAMDELKEQTANHLAGKEVKNEQFAHPIPFNVIPHIDSFTENLYTKEEMKVTNETRKIFAEPSLALSCTAVRIPTFRAHAESVTLETEKPINPKDVQELLKNTPGVELVDNPTENSYPMPLTASNKYDVEVGRIRQSLIFGEHGIDFFVCGDQLLKGAALNAVQIAELI